MTPSHLKVFVVVEPDGHRRVAFGLTLSDAFKTSGIPELWMGYRRYGLIKEYPIRDWFKKIMEEQEDES